MVVTSMVLGLVRESKREALCITTSPGTVQIQVSKINSILSLADTAQQLLPCPFVRCCSPGEFNGMIPEQLPVFSYSFRMTAASVLP